MTTHDAHTAKHAISLTIPPGYHEMPLTNIAEVLASAEPAVKSITPPALSDSIPSVLGTLEFLLGTLAAKNAVYCGIGQHQSPEGDSITSWLIVTIQNYGEKVNPRLVVRNLAEMKLANGNSSSIEPFEINGRPMLISQAVAEYPAPAMPNLPSTGDTASAFQTEILIPSSDGQTLASIEFSTAALTQGAMYLDMLLAMAHSVDFQEIRSTASSLDL
ncbi:hypothetical protein [Nocardia sp. NPDC051832]|uniref:hypothetical protein n=1 Tax=Nocardia sp. NPDC051832 TaxID=3155673 RepID=UPI00341431BA